MNRNGRSRLAMVTKTVAKVAVVARVAIAASAVLGAGACGAELSQEPSGAQVTDHGSKVTRLQESSKPSTPTTEPPARANESAPWAVDRTSKGELDATTVWEIKTFVAEFMSAGDEAWTTGDTSQVRKLYVGSCHECLMADAYLDKVYGDGGRIEGGEYVAPKIGNPSLDRDTVRVQVEVTVSAYEEYDAMGNVVDAAEAEQIQEVFDLKQTKAGWQVTAWRTTSP